MDIGKPCGVRESIEARAERILLTCYSINEMLKGETPESEKRPIENYKAERITGSLNKIEGILSEIKEEIAKI